jgi:hypothetical protein
MHGHKFIFTTHVSVVYDYYQLHTKAKGCKMRSIKGNEEFRFRTVGMRAEILVYTSIPGVSVFKL